MLFYILLLIGLTDDRDLFSSWCWRAQLTSGHRHAFHVTGPFRRKSIGNNTLRARFTGPTWGPPGADRTQVGPMTFAICVVLTMYITQTGRPSGWQPWYSLETLKIVFNVSCEYQGSHPDDLFISVMFDKRVVIIQEEGFQLPVPFQDWEMIENANIFLCIQNIFIQCDERIAEPREK